SCAPPFYHKGYQSTVKKPAPDPSNLRYVPHKNQNPHAGQIYARFRDEALDNNYSLKQRYVQHVLNGDFKNDTIFNGIIEAKILAKTREIKGLGMQNFKH
ncbi:hypothetical protein B0H10DRAFT_1657585, partial [Mycena sp. CBHHK59/15]